MIETILLTLIGTVAGMFVVTFFIKGVLGLRTGINLLVQLAVFATIGTVAAVSALELTIMLGVPLVLFVVKTALTKWVNYRARSGAYGQEVAWAYELVEIDQDAHFTHAHNVLPQREVREVRIIADSKQELRDTMIERYNELASEQLSNTGTNNQL